jgi:drug/metabolite transporter (DMT)-like permease
MRRILRFLFKGELEPGVFVGRIGVGEGSDGGDGGRRFKVIMLASWALAIVLVLCIVAVFYFAYHDKTVPDYIPPIITAIIGYFGGVLSAFFGLNQ